MTGRHEDALDAVEARCPRCGAERSRRQEYCVECGLRLPTTSGAIPALRRHWVRRLGWYPGDWIWVSLLTLLVAVAGAAVAIAFGSSSGPASGETVVAPPPTTTHAATTTSQLPTLPATTGKTSTTTTATHTTTSAAPPGHTPWPSGRDGWTNVLFSYPVTGGTDAPYTTAVRAAKEGLPDVGVLDSSDFASLHPGYYVVFSGVYSSAGEAQAALKTAQATGFATAYTRQITR